MKTLIRLLIPLLLFGLFHNCKPKTNGISEIKEQFAAGNFKNAGRLIDRLNSSELAAEQLNELEIINAKMERIRLDFSKDEMQIRTELAKWFPDLTDEQLRQWETSNKLEMKLIDGEKRYFEYAVQNLFRLDSNARKKRDSIEGEHIDSLKIFCTNHSFELIQQANSGINLLEKPQKYQVVFTITLFPNTIPNGEVVKCWMPFPRESFPRQKNIKLVSVNSDKYILSDNDAMQRALYMEKVTEKDKPLVFSYTVLFETAAQYITVHPDSVKPYKTNSEFFKNYTAERKPHIVFSDEIKQLTDKVTTGILNPAEKVKAIYYWIDKNIPWASALEYSTIECIPEYVLKNRHGDCGMKTLLFMSMARYAGIPCKWQSGWMLHPGKLNLHDWCEVYYEGIGWVPLDQSFGLQNMEEPQVKEFYISGIDEFRLIINDDFGSRLIPEKHFYRSEPIDFQRGELEWKGGNIYFNHWDYHVDISYLD